MAFIPYPYDWIAGWCGQHDIKLSKEAYTELVDWLERLDRINEERVIRLKQRHGIQD